MTAKRLCRAGQLVLALAGLALVVIPIGIRFTGYFLWGCLGVWIIWELLARWAKRSRTGKACFRIYCAGVGLGVVCLVSIEAVIISHGEVDNSALPGPARRRGPPAPPGASPDRPPPRRCAFAGSARGFRR